MHVNIISCQFRTEPVAVVEAPATSPLKKAPAPKVVMAPTPSKPAYAVGLTQSEEKDLARKAILKQEEDNRVAKQHRKEIAEQEEAEAGTAYLPSSLHRLSPRARQYMQCSSYPC